METPIITIDGVGKEYRLGAIGSATLQGDLQSWWAKLRGREDPNAKLGNAAGGKNARFLALDDVSLTVQPGDTLGIIGSNGAGKSTLLKLLSRVTAPTTGTIVLRGRVASMLEVGTGFHQELTGRENVYLNGAILGMSKAEIDRKFDEIVAFSEIEQFIDTPVKRYSSGMYVKLAFSVAAHLDNEIMIMDEVLAVGDIRFQQKCLNKMSSAATLEGRTILYVSHNMRTVRQLCKRCAVLEKGRLIYDGGTEGAIDIYAGATGFEETANDLSGRERTPYVTQDVLLQSIEITQHPNNLFEYGDVICLGLYWQAKQAFAQLRLKLHFYTMEDTPVGVAYPGGIPPGKGENNCAVTVDTAYFSPGKYKITLVVYESNEFGNEVWHDNLDNCLFFEVVNSEKNKTFAEWHSVWGNTVLKGACRVVDGPDAGARP